MSILCWVPLGFGCNDNYIIASLLFLGGIKIFFSLKADITNFYPTAAETHKICHTIGCGAIQKKKNLAVHTFDSTLIRIGSSLIHCHLQYPAGTPPFLGSEVAYISPSITSMP